MFLQTLLPLAGDGSSPAERRPGGSAKKGCGRAEAKIIRKAIGFMNNLGGESLGEGSK
jgi:hypothetical protein